MDLTLNYVREKISQITAPPRFKIEDIKSRLPNPQYVRIDGGLFGDSTIDIRELNLGELEILKAWLEGEK